MAHASFLSAAVKMDAVAPAGSVRALAAMHRWPTPDGQPPAPLSLRSMLARHVHPQKVEARLLWYNTFLLPGVEIPLATLVAFLAGGLLIGVLSDWIGITRLRVGEKPARELRAREIGQALGAYGYDIAALCEVFDPEDRDRILAGVDTGFRRIGFAEGPETSGAAVAPSGLLTLVADRPLYAQRHSFSERGNKFRDADAWSTKGVLRTVIDLGIGSVELYSSHLFNGGWEDPITEGERAPVQDAQLDELVEFFERTHERQHVALIVGDCNIDAHNPNRYGALMNRMGRLGMVDLWAERNMTRGDTSDIKEQRENICPFDADRRFCDDLWPHRQEGIRIDFIFVERQRPEHTCVLDLTRPRRVPFERPRETDGLQFMSDHIGLETVLIATPR